jgi:hypothetical protein
MGLTHNSATYAVNKWNQVWFRSDAAGAFPANSVELSSFAINTVPEPATWALLAGSLTIVMVFRRRRQA